MKKGQLVMIGIGTTLYMFNENRRVYERDENNKAKGGPIYAEHFEPVEIHGETKVSWLCGPRYSVSKVNKKEIQSGRAGSYFTAEGMVDNIWANHHRYKLRCLVDAAAPDQLRQIAVIVGYEPK